MHQLGILSVHMSRYQGFTVKFADAKGTKRSAAAAFEDPYDGHGARRVR